MSTKLMLITLAFFIFYVKSSNVGKVLYRRCDQLCLVKFAKKSIDAKIT